MAFPYILKQICFDLGVLELPGIDQFLSPKTTTYLGLIRYIANLISKVAKLGEIIIQGDFKFSGNGDEILRLTNIGDTTETNQSNPQTSDVEGTLQNFTPLPTVEPQPSTSMLVLAGYILVLQLFLSELQKSISTMDMKVRLMEREVKPQVDERIKEEMRVIKVRFDGFEQCISQQLEGIQSPN